MVLSVDDEWRFLLLWCLRVSQRRLIRKQMSCVSNVLDQRVNVKTVNFFIRFAGKSLKPLDKQQTATVASFQAPRPRLWTEQLRILQEETDRQIEPCRDPLSPAQASRNSSAVTLNQTHSLTTGKYVACSAWTAFTVLEGGGYGTKRQTQLFYLGLIALAKCNFQCVHNQSCSADQSSAVFPDKLYPENLFEMPKYYLLAFQMFLLFLVLRFNHDS